MTDLIERGIRRAKSYSDDSPLYDLHPELQGRIPLMRVYSDQQSQIDPAGYEIAAKDYTRQAWVHKAVRVVADNISPHPLEVIRGTKDEEEVIDDHPLIPILQLSNQDQSPSDMWKEWTTSMLIGGEQGLEITYNGLNQPWEMWSRTPNIFTVEPGVGGLRYRRVSKYVVDDGEGRPYALKPEQFIHSKFYNPVNPWRGIAPISAIRVGIIIDQLAQAWSRMFFKNSARPDYAVMTDEALTAGEREELEERLSDDHGRPAGWHKPLVPPGVVKDIKILNFPPKDLEWLEQRRFSRDEIGAIFGVPDEIMGYGRDTYENFPTAFRVLWVLTIEPLISFRDNILTNWFRRQGLLQPIERIQTDKTGIPRLPEDEDKKAERYAKLVQHGVPPNVAARIVALSIPELEGGDVGYLPISYLPTTSVRGASIPEREDEEVASIQPREKWAYGRGAPEYGSQEHKEIFKRREQTVRTLKDGMKRKVRKFFQMQQNRVVRALRNQNQLGRGKFMEKQDEDDLLPAVGGVFDLQAEIAAFEEEFGPIVLSAFDFIAREEIELLGIEIVWDLASAEVQAAISHILATVANKTQNTVWLGIIELFEEAEAEGVGIVEMQERLSAYYGDLKSDYQTERIARTTMTGASNSARLEVWEMAEGVRESEWLSALTPRSRDTHMAAHGQRRKIREAFDIGGEALMYPGDPNASVGNIANCLCHLVPVVGGAESERSLAPVERREEDEEFFSDAIIPRAKMPKQPASAESEDEEMKVEIHNHYPEYPDELIGQIVRGLPVPQVNIPAASLPDIKVEPRIEVQPPDVHVKVEPPPPAEVVVNVEAPEIEVKATVEMPEYDEEIEISERDGLGRVKKMLKKRIKINDKEKK